MTAQKAPSEEILNSFRKNERRVETTTPPTNTEYAKRSEEMIPRSVVAIIQETSPIVMTVIFVILRYCAGRVFLMRDTTSRVKMVEAEIKHVSADDIIALIKHAATNPPQPYGYACLQYPW